MVGVLPETTGGMMFETSIGGKKEDCDFATGQSRCQPILLGREFIVSNFACVHLTELLPAEQLDPIAMRPPT